MDIERLDGLVSSDVASVREGVAVELGSVGSPMAVSMLSRLIQDTDFSVRMAAVKSLGGSDTRDAVAPLLVAQESIDDEFRQAASDSLVLLGAKFDIVPDLLSRVIFPKPTSRKAAVWVLGVLHDERAFDPIGNALKDEQDYVRRAAAFALGKFNDLDAIPWLVDGYLHDTDTTVKDAALFSIQKLLTCCEAPKTMADLVMRQIQNKPVYINVKIQCPFCGGEGYRRNGKACTACDATGTIMR